LPLLRSVRKCLQVPLYELCEVVLRHAKHWSSPALVDIC
jgi:hypothetical protein